MPVKISCHEDCWTCIPAFGLSVERAGSGRVPYLCLQSLYLTGTSSPMGLCGIILSHFLALNAAFCVFWLLVRKRYALFPLCVFLLGWGALTTYLPWQFTKADEPKGEVIKVLTYNTLGMHPEKMKKVKR